MATVLRSRSFRISAALLFIPVLVVLLVLLGVLPIRAYASQRREMIDATQRLSMLTTKNAELRNRVRLLQTDSEIKRIARDQYAMVPVGEPLRVVPGLRDTTAPGSTLARTALADRVPVAVAETSETSMWGTLSEFVRFAFS